MVGVLGQVPGPWESGDKGERSGGSPPYQEVDAGEAFIGNDETVSYIGQQVLHSSSQRDTSHCLSVTQGGKPWYWGLGRRTERAEETSGWNH